MDTNKEHVGSQLTFNGNEENCIPLSKGAVKEKISGYYCSFNSCGLFHIFFKYFALYAQGT